MRKGNKIYLLLICCAIIIYTIILSVVGTKYIFHILLKNIVFILSILNFFDIAEIKFNKNIHIRSLFEKNTINKLYNKCKTFEDNSVICRAFREDNIKVFSFFCVCFIGFTTIYYSDYLFGGRNFIFDGGAADSYTQVYPWFVYQAREWTNGHILGRWNFANSLGKYESGIFPSPTTFLVMFGENNIAYLMGFFQYIKVILSGFFFYGYLRTIGITRRTSSIFAFLYSYNPWLTSLSYWRGYPGEALLMAIWLFCFERFNVKKDYRWLPFATALMFIDNEAYFFVLYSAVFFVYSIFRFFSESKKSDNILMIVKKILFTSLCLFWGGMISSYIEIPSLISNLNSNRFNTDVTVHLMSGVFSSARVVATALFRTLGTDIIGVFMGSDGIILFEPKFYCGLITLVLIPVAVYGMSRRKRCWYLFGFLIVYVYIIFVPLRAASNAFSSENFSNSSFWIIVLMLITAAQGLDSIECIPQFIRKKIMISSGGIFLIIVFIYTHVMWCFENELHYSILLMIVYTVLCCCVDTSKLNIYFTIFMITIFELSHMFVTPNLFLSRNSGWKERKMFYYDYSVEALAEINDIDHDFFRISKEFTYNTMFLCDSLVQDYMGTVGYNGGVGDQHYTSEFYRELAFPIYRGDHYAYGFNESTEVNTLLNVKYILSKSKNPLNYGYSMIGKAGYVYIYKNDNYLPFGITYDKYMLRADFDKLTIAAKRNIMMKAIILEKEPMISGLTRITLEDHVVTDPFDMINDIEKYRVEDLSEDSNRIEIEPLDDENVLVVDIRVDNQDDELYIANPRPIMSDLNNAISFETDDGMHYFHQGFLRGEDRYIYEFNNPGIQTVNINITNDMCVKDYNLYVIPKEIYYMNYKADVHRLKADSMENVDRSNNLVGGSINVDDNKMLFFSIPFDEDWHLYVDGEEHELLQSNIGFMSCEIEPGTYDIVLKYEPTKVYEYCSFGGGILYILYLIVYEIIMYKRGIKGRKNG